MSAPPADALLDPSRRWRVVLRHHQAGQFGAFQFGAGGAADVVGGRALYRLVAAFGTDVESVTEIREQQASTEGEVPDVSPAATVSAAPGSRMLTDEQRAALLIVTDEALAFMGPEAREYIRDLRADPPRYARALRESGLSWAKIGNRMGLSGERARQLGRDARVEADAP